VRRIVPRPPRGNHSSGANSSVEESNEIVIKSHNDIKRLKQIPPLKVGAGTRLLAELGCKVAENGVVAELSKG
jgi:hypothetical protein